MLPTPRWVLKFKYEFGSLWGADLVLKQVRLIYNLYKYCPTALFYSLSWKASEKINCSVSDQKIASSI